MTSCDQSRTSSGATRPTSLLSTRTLVGTWNVRTMYETSKSAQVSAEMKKYCLSILRISEVRWIQSGLKRLLTGELLIYSGYEKENSPHTDGVALMLSSQAQAALIGWEAHGPRIIAATFKTRNKRIRLNVIQCYAPTNDSEEEDKEDFYHRLQTVDEKYSNKDVNIVMGDVNAKIGSRNEGYSEIMGTQGVGTMNENGEKFLDFCALNNLVIEGSIFKHKDIDKFWS